MKAKSNYGYKHEKKKPKTQITTKYLIKKTKDKNSKIWTQKRKMEEFQKRNNFTEKPLPLKETGVNIPIGLFG